MQKQPSLTDVDPIEQTHTVYAIAIEFIGTNYRGWQRQKEVLCVQEVVENVISQIANEPIEVVAAGRTDAGVHASHMIAHFSTQANRPAYNWLRGANSLLPDDIAIKWIQAMPAEFHARFRAIARRYCYVFINQPQRPAILKHQVTHIHQPLDRLKMQTACKDIVGTHDFTSFRAAACQSNQPVRTVKHAQFYQQGQLSILDIQADGFLHHMVRNLMGSLFAIGAGSLPVDGIKQLIAMQDRTKAPATAAADGLYFINAYYPEHYQKQFPESCITPVWLHLPETN